MHIAGFNPVTYAAVLKPFAVNRQMQECIPYGSLIQTGCSYDVLHRNKGVKKEEHLLPGNGNSFRFAANRGSPSLLIIRLIRVPGQVARIESQG